jgi:hypothetical protein
MPGGADCRISLAPVRLKSLELLVGRIRRLGSIDRFEIISRATAAPVGAQCDLPQNRARYSNTDVAEARAR